MKLGTLSSISIWRPKALYDVCNARADIECPKYGVPGGTKGEEPAENLPHDRRLVLLDRPLQQAQFQDRLTMVVQVIFLYVEVRDSNEDCIKRHKHYFSTYRDDECT